MQGDLPPQSGGDAIAAAHEALLKQADIQFTFPSAVVREPRAAPKWLQAIADLINALFSGAGSFLSVVFWVVIALLAVGLLYIIARESGWIAWASKAARPKGGPRVDQYQPDAELAAGLLADADRLAAQGRYDEAVHVLLLRSIEDMDRFRPRSVSPAATSRDLARLEILPAEARRAFSAMASLVETSLFGRRPVGPTGYAQCREAYESFAFPRVWS